MSQDSDTVIFVVLACVTLHNILPTHYQTDHHKAADEHPNYKDIPDMWRQGQVLVVVGATQGGKLCYSGGHKTETLLKTLLQYPCWGCSMAE